MTPSFTKYGPHFAAVLVLGIAGVCAAQSATEITLPGTRLFTESITSTKDGTLIIGSLGKGDISRIALGTTRVEEWISPRANELNAVFGVFADEKFRTLWVCSDKTDNGVGRAALKAFDLKTGAPKGSYDLPGNSPFCNDTAVAADGTAYVTDTGQATVLMLRRGAKELEVAAKDPLLAGADGLAFGEKTALYVNSVSSGKLLRVNLGQDGRSKSIVELKLSKALMRPDGMRTISKNRLLLAENGGNMDIVTFYGSHGENAKIDTIKQGLESTPAVTATRGVAWIAEGKLNYRSDPKLKDKDTGTFKIYAVQLPPK